MKRLVIGIVLVLLIGWTVYDTLYADQERSSAHEEPQEAEEIDGTHEHGTDAPQAMDIDDDDDVAGAALEAAGPQVGEQAPDFTLPTLAGDHLTLSDLKGKKVIVNVWATWCPPCRAEMPDMQAFYEDHGDEVEIVAVNLFQSERAPEHVDEFVDEYQLTFPVVLDEKSEVAKAYFALTIPTSYVIDTNGVIQKKMIGPMSYEWMEEVIESIN